jgi:hypothetical protein
MSTIETRKAATHHPPAVDADPFPDVSAVAIPTRGNLEAGAHDRGNTTRISMGPPIMRRRCSMNNPHRNPCFCSWELRRGRTLRGSPDGDGSLPSAVSCATETVAHPRDVRGAEGAGTPSRRSGAFRTFRYQALHGKRAPKPALPSSKEAAARPNGVVADLLINHSNDDAVRVTLGGQGRPRRPVSREGAPQSWQRPGQWPRRSRDSSAQSIGILDGWLL